MTASPEIVPGRYSSPETIAIRTELKAKAEQLGKIFDESAVEGGKLDLTKSSALTGTSAERAAEVKRRNDEMSDLGKKLEVHQARDDVKSMREYLERPQEGGFLFPATATAPKDSPKAKFGGKSIGDLFVESAAFKEFSAPNHRSPAVEIDLGDPRAKDNPGVELKTLLDRTAWSVEPDRLATIVPGALRRPVVADLIPQGATASATIKYMEETTTTNAAAAVAEGAAKPESALAFTARTATVEKIATVLPVTDELFEDAPAMRTYVEQRLRLFLKLAEETALLSGTGTTPQIRGLLNFSGIQTQAKGADPTPTAVYKALTLIRANAFVDPDGVIFHPLDWQDVATLQTADGIYIWGQPNAAMPVERIWGLPVIVTPAITQNTALVGAFGAVTMLFRRNAVTFAVSDQHSDWFIYNKLMLRVEERLALACFRPAGLCTVTGV
jgi:HK97 family phage major capsid protein